MGETPDFTRRTLLGGAAAVGAASLLRPGTGLAAALAPGPSIATVRVGLLAGQPGRAGEGRAGEGRAGKGRGVQGAAPVVQAPRTFALVGVQWTSPPDARVELRTRARDGSWGPWARASVRGHDPDGEPAKDGLFGEPIWTGAADFVQLRSPHPVRGVRLHFVSRGGLNVARAARYPLAQPILNAGPGQPPIIARQAWAQGQAPPRHVPPFYGTIKLAFIHHSQTPNGYSRGDVPSMLLSIFDYHRYTRGFFDIAYNFAIDAYGRIWEARAGGIDMPVIGAQAGGYNTESTGVVVLGSYMDVAPSGAAIAALERLVAWKLSLHGLPARGRVTVVVNPADAFYTPFKPGAHVSLPRVAGHRDGDSTDCPGDAFYARLPSIRRRIVRLAGTPARVTLNIPETAGAATAFEASGRLSLLGGRPLAGAPIEIQRFTGSGSARTITGAISASDGTWKEALGLRHNASLRALHRPHPATVTDWVEIAVAPQIELRVDSVSPLRVSGSIDPPKRAVTVDLYAVAPNGRRRRIAHKRVAVKHGGFAAGFGARRPGAYQLLARSAEDDSNAAGTSSPLDVDVP